MSPTANQFMVFLRDELGIDVAGLTSEAPLFSSGLIDSFSLVTLLSYIEETFGFRVGPMDVSLDNFDSIDRITAYVAAMAGARA